MGPTGLQHLGYRAAAFAVVLEVLAQAVQERLDLLRRVEAPQRRELPSGQSEVGQPGKALRSHGPKKI